MKRSPFLYELLLPTVRFWRERRARDHERRTIEFRRWCSNIPDNVSEPFFVKVGAHDGTTGDPSSDILLADPRWKGLLIEPVPYLFDRLRTQLGDTRRFILENLAVGVPAGEASFYYVHPAARDNVPGLHSWFDQVGALSKDHIVKHLGPAVEPFIVEGKVPIEPLSSILRRHEVTDVHLLQIDTEGHDDEVLKTIDLNVYKPLMIFMEHKHLSESRRKELLDLLRSHSYKVMDCGTDYFALDRQARHRLHLTG